MSPRLKTDRSGEFYLLTKREFWSAFILALILGWVGRGLWAAYI
jgi:hypothetical protein